MSKPSYTLTFDDAVQIHLLIWDGELQSRIAAKYDVNGGRISEVNTGKRHPGSAKVAAEIYRHRRSAA
ncbi:MAG: hypothetical protein J0H65_05470 [Rhizobiales bacterium]|nr:hypothetical protein [Hyphomicrobiales bacterium]